jgi:hypothetical protein
MDTGHTFAVAKGELEKTMLIFYEMYKSRICRGCLGKKHDNL